MTSPLRRVLAALLLLSLVASACGSSSDSTDDTASSSESAGDGVSPTATSQADATTDDATTDDAATDDAEGTSPTSIPLPDDDAAADSAIAGLDADPAADAEPADPRTTAQDFVRNLFNIDPEPAALDCIIAQTASDETLDAALRIATVAVGEVDDTQMQALTQAMNGCVPAINLADWATQAIGPQGEVQQTAPPCFAARFEAETTGDVTFYNFVALTYQFRLEPTGVAELIDTLSTCAPITSLSDFFATQEEQASGFEIQIDRACLADSLRPDEVTVDFWTVFTDGITPPATFIAPFLDGCASAAYSEFADALPEDFVPWSGTGALATVRPSARAGIYSAPPPMTIDPSASYEAVLATGGGDIRVRLLADTAPVTVNSFVSLARDGYFDGTVFHRVIDGFMAQAGDPTGTGTGGPGYQFEDEFIGGPTIDRKGLLAMANSGPGTNGSQFFITFAPAEHLTGVHTVFGEVIEGIELVDAIERRDPSAPASRGQVVESVTIIES